MWLLMLHVCCSYLLALTEGRSTEDEARVLSAWRRQVDLETKALEEAVQKYKDELGSMRRTGTVERHPTANRLITQWFEPLRDAIAAEQHQASSRHCGEKLYAYTAALCLVWMSLHLKHPTAKCIMVK